MSPPLDRLAQVELQLVMQHCGLHSLLALARCNHFTLAAASHPFAWRYSPQLVVRVLDADLPVRLAASSLLCHCSVNLVLTPDGHWSCPPPIAEEELRVISQLSRLQLLGTRSCTLEPTNFADLLRQPALAGLTALYTSKGQLDSECVRLLPHLRGLHTLHLASPDGVSATDFFAPLPLLSSLTDLSLATSPNDQCSASAVGRCAALRHLSLDSLLPNDWLAVLTAPAMRHLESLSVRAWSWHTAIADWDVIFSNLPALRSLAVRRCITVSYILPAAATHCPGLRSLCISLEGPTRQFQHEYFAIPPTELLEHVLDTLSNLDALELQLPPSPPANLTKLLLEWEKARAEWDEFQCLHPHRVQLTMQ